MKAPAVIVNFKVYSEVEGGRAFNLAKICQKVSKESGVRIAVCPPVLALGVIAQALEIPVYSQNVDPLEPGSGTGRVTPTMLHSADVKGSLINHSENRKSHDDIAKCITMCRAHDLVSCVCAESVDEAKIIASMSPDMIAVEPPELIGGTVSVTTANPAVVSGTVDAVHSVDSGISVYCGAGVKTGEDVRTAMDLGATGVLLASGIVKSKDPEAALRDLIKYI